MTTLQFQGPISFDTADGRGLNVDALIGAYVKSMTPMPDGTTRVVLQLADNLPMSFNLDAAFDQTARAAAAMAQAEIDAHEVSVHNTDTAARAAAATAQDEIDAHEADHPSGVTISTTPPGNTPGSPVAGDSGDVSDAGHDHGITPGGGGGSVDQTARDSAEAAQTAADAAQAEIDTHDVSTHNTDTTARSVAAAALSEIDTHEASTHNTDLTARANALAAQAAADGVQAEVLAHNASEHNTDQVARDGVSANELAVGTASASASDANAAAVTAQDAADTAQMGLDAHTLMHPTGSGVVVDVRTTGFPTPSADTVGIFYDDGAHLKFGISDPINSVDPLGTFAAVATVNPYLGAFTSLAALLNAHRPGETTPGHFGWVWGFDSGIYRLAETNGVRGYTHDASGTAVQADLDRLPGNSTGDSFWLGQDRHDVGSLSGLASIDAARKYYYGNSTSALAGIRLLDNTTFVAGTASHTDYRLVDVFTGHNPQPDDVIVFEGHGRPQFDPDYVGQTAVNYGGREWVSGFRFVDHSTDPSWTAANLADVSWNRWLGAFEAGMSGLFSVIGSFEFRANVHRFHQLDQNGNTVNRTWSQLIDWFRSNQTHLGNVPAGLIPLAGQKSIFLSGPHTVFDDDDAAAAFLAGEQTDTPATKVFVWFTGDVGDVENWTLRWATAGGFVAGVTDITEELFWSGPLAIDAGGAGTEVTSTASGSAIERTTLAARNGAAASIGRTVRHLTLSTALADLDDNDDIEIILESSSTSRVINPQIRFQAKLLKDRVVSTFANGMGLSSPTYTYTSADALKYLEFKVTRGDSTNAHSFAHDTVVVGRIGAGTTANPDKIVIWAANTSAVWSHYWVNRVQYGATEAGEQQLGDGSVGGYYFGAFYQQAATEPAFNGVPDNDGAWSSLGDWHASRGDAVDAASTDPVWIAYASGYVSSSDVTFVNAPQVFAEFSTQYSNDGFSTITGVAPVDPDGWWRRDRLPGGGVTAPLPLFHTDNPWIPVWAEEDFYTRNGDGESKDIDLNLNNVTAIRFTLTPFGLWSDDGIPERPGAVCTDVMPRPPVGWSTSEFNDSSRAATGLYSVYYHESAGLQVHHQNDGSAADFNIPTGSYRDTDYPARAWACALKFIAPNTNDLLLLTALRIFDSPQHYERFLWTIEVQREN